MGLLALLIGASLSAWATPWPSVLPEGVEAPAPPMSVPVTLPAATATAPLGAGLLLEVKGALHYFDPATGETRLLQAPSGPVALSPKGAVAGLSGGVARRVDPQTGAVLWQASTAATQLGWSADGGAVILGGDNHFTALDADTGVAMEAPDSRSLRYAYARPQQRLALITGGRLDLYDNTGAARLLEAPQGEAITALSLSPDGTRLAALGPGLRVWDADSHNLVYEKSDATAVAWSPDGGHLVVASPGELLLKEVNGNSDLRIQIHVSVQQIAFDGSGAIILWVPGGARRLVLPTGAQRSALAAGELSAAAIGTQAIALGTDTGIIQVWSRQGVLLSELHAPGPVRALAITPDGRSLAAMAPQPLIFTAAGPRPCAPTEALCAGLTRPAPTPDASLDGSLLAVVGDTRVEAIAHGARLHEGARVSVIYPGPDGAWARWADGRYTWGAPDAALLSFDGETPLLPPREEAKLSLSAAPLVIFQGDTQGIASLTVRNEGPGRAFSVQLSAGDVKGEVWPRLDPGQEVKLSLPVPAAGTSIAVTSRYTQLVNENVSGVPSAWPLSTKGLKRKGQSLKLTLASAGGLDGAQVWVSCVDSKGQRWAVASGVTGKIGQWTEGVSPVGDGLSLAPGKQKLEYRLPDKAATELQLWVQPAGGLPRAMPL